MKTVILAGGLGSRLSEETHKIPKPMIEVGDKPIVSHIINHFMKYNFSEFTKAKKEKKVAYFIWKKPWMVAANNTFINHLLEVNNFENVFKNKERYPEISLEKLNEVDNLDFIFLSSEPYPFREKHILELKNKFKKTTITLVDGELFSWYGTRLLFAFDYFKKLHNSL